jgi:membrane protease subunit HflC
MTKSQRPVVIAIGAVFALIVLLSSLYTVHQTQQALVLQFGEPAAVVTEPGLHLKAPWPFQNVLYISTSASSCSRFRLRK